MVDLTSPTCRAASSAMAIEGEIEERLYDFLKASFRLEDFQRFLTFQDGG
jgi:hypothetical protein